MLPSMLHLIAPAFLESEMFDNITTKSEFSDEEVVCEILLAFLLDLRKYFVLHAGLVDESQRANVWKYFASVVEGTHLACQVLFPLGAATTVTPVWAEPLGAATTITPVWVEHLGAALTVTPALPLCDLDLVEASCDRLS